jgi:hypothetical protein
MLFIGSILKLEKKTPLLFKIAEKFTKQTKKKKSRYRFILGQLYEELGKKDSAIYNESVIDMNRKSERKYVIQAQARKRSCLTIKRGYNHF